MTTPVTRRPGGRIATIPVPVVPHAVGGGIWVLTLPTDPGNDSDLRSPALGSESGNDQPIAHAPILIVDDDPAILATVSRILETEGYTFTTAVDGLSALTEVAERQPRLIILDMRMPVMDGWAFARELRARGHEIPILVMTAASDARRWAAEVNAAAYVAKPFDLDDLLDKIEQTLGPDK